MFAGDIASSLAAALNDSAKEFSVSIMKEVSGDIKFSFFFEETVDSRDLQKKRYRILNELKKQDKHYTAELEAAKEVLQKFESAVLQTSVVISTLRQKDKEIERLKEVERTLLSELEKHKDFATYYRMHQAMLHNKQVTEVPAK